jgi:hypothetical protein
MFVVDDIITAGVGIVNNLVKVHKWDEWFKALLGLHMSFLLCFSGACGTALIAGRYFSVALGYGLTSGAGAVLAYWSYNPKLRGVMIVKDKRQEQELSNYQGELKP